MLLREKSGAFKPNDLGSVAVCSCRCVSSYALPYMKLKWVRVSGLVGGGLVGGGLVGGGLVGLMMNEWVGLWMDWWIGSW